MTKEELKKEAKEYTKNLLKKLGIKEDMLLEKQSKYLRLENMNFVALNVKNVTDAYLASAEPREKRIAELEKKIKSLEGNSSLHEGILWNDIHNQDKKIAELEAQIEKLIDFVLSKIECCDVCPITDTCINSEGTCPYAGILAKGEEEVTREWLMQFISKEIKEK